MGKIENQSNEEFEIIGKNFGTGITLPSLCGQDQVDGEFLNLGKPTWVAIA